MDFKAIAERWWGLPRRDRTKPPLPSLELDRFLKALTAPGARGWFAACQSWVARKGPSPDGHPEIQEVLYHFSRSRDPFRYAVARAHLDVARLLLDSHQPSPADLRAIAEQAGIRAGLLRDLIQELLPADRGGGGPRPKAGTQALMALLVDHVENRGVAAWLDLDLIADGAGEFYPHPGLAFVARDERWVQAEETACDYVQKAGIWTGQDRLDIRWSLLGRNEIPSALNGDSIGAAFALGLVRLLTVAKEEGLHASLLRFKGVDVASVSVSAGVRVDRKQCRLRAVDHIPEKLEAASRARTACNLRFILLSEENRPEVEKGFYRGLLSDDPQMELRVVCADTLSKAAASLVEWQRVSEAIQRGLARERGPEPSAPVPALLTPQEPVLSQEKLYLKWLVGETRALSQPWQEAPILPTPARIHRSPDEEGQGRALLYRRFPPDASQNPVLNVSARPAQAGSEAPVEIEDLAKALQKFQKVVVLGGPGSGKSVCLRRFARDLAGRELRRRGRPRTLPILVGMGAYSGQEDGGPTPVLKFLRQWLLSVAPH